MTKLRYEKVNLLGRDIYTAEYGTNLLTLVVDGDKIKVNYQQRPDTAPTNTEHMLKIIQEDFPNKTLIINEGI